MAARRIDMDVMKLIALKYEVTMLDTVRDFTVKFHGPKDTVYEGGIWNVKVSLSNNYPFEPPKIIFDNHIFHPNISANGRVCLNVITQNWSSLYDLSNIFETFLPQLLTYPNANDPYHEEASHLYLSNPVKFRETVKLYISKYASYCEKKKEEKKKTSKPADDDSDLSELSGNEDAKSNSSKKSEKLK